MLPRRPTAPQEHPEAKSVGDVAKLAGERWKAADAAERARWEEQAKKDKETYEAAYAAWAQEYPLAAADDRKGGKRKAKGPQQGATGGAKKAKKAEGGRRPAATAVQRAEAAPAEGEGSESDEEEEEGSGLDTMAAAAAVAAAEPSKRRARGRPAKKPKGEKAVAAADQEQDRGEESEDEHLLVDWEAGPAEAILAETSDGKFLVQRRALDLSEYGLMDGAAARAQHPALVRDWEAFNRDFQQ